MRLHFLICLLVSSFLLHTKKNTVQPRYGWSTTGVRTQLSSPRGVVIVLKIFLDVPRVKMWNFCLSRPPDVARSLYTDGMKTLLPKEPERTLLKPICSQANPIKPLGLGEFEVCAFTVDSDIIVRLVCCLFRKPWAEWTHSSDPRVVFSGRMEVQCQDNIKNPTKQHYSALKDQLNPKIEVSLLQNIQSLPYNLLKLGWWWITSFSFSNCSSRVPHRPPNLQSTNVAA